MGGVWKWGGSLEMGRMLIGCVLGADGFAPLG